MKKLLYLFISLAFTAVSFAQVQIVSVDTTGESCEGADDGRIFITTTSGALPITYFVSGGSFNATIIQNFDTLTVKNLPAQNYVVVAQDINGDFDFKSFDISAGRAISTPIITSNAPLCLNNILTFSAASDAGASYQWTGPNSFTSTNQSFFITNVTAANAGNYDVYATGLGKQSKVCSSAVATKNVVISPVPNSSFTISKASPCVNENITLTFTGSAQSGALYDWNPAGGNISGPDNLKTVRWSTSGPKNVTLQVSNNGCLSTTTTRLVNVVNQPQAVISGIDTICIGQSSNLTITFTGTAPWIYTYNNAGTPATINTSNNPATIVVSPSVTTNYFGTSINDAQCAGVPTGLATINVNSAPSASIKDTTIAVCNGSSTTIPISFSGTAPFNYQYTDGTTTFSGTSNTISSSITVNPSVSTTYSLVSVTDGICSGTVSGTSVINVSPSPTSTFTIPSTSCLNSDVTVTYTGSASPTASYNWNFGGGVVVSGSGQGPHQIRWLTTGPKTVRLTVSENGCTSSQTTNNITILTRPDVRLITSNQSICAGNSVTLSFLSSGTAPYTYQFTDGTTTFSRTTSSVLSTSLLSPSTTSTYSIVSVGDANCTNGTFSGTTVVTVRPVPTSTFSVSPAGLCTNQAATITYTGTGNAGATYNWTFAGGTPASATGQGPHNVSWSAPGTNNVSLSVVQSSCPSTVTTTPVTVINQPTATISGANTICSGNSTNLSVSFTGTAPYNFTYSDGSTSTSVTTSSNPHVIAVSPATTRTYTLTAFNDNNCNGTFGGSAAITVNPTPTLTTSTTQNVCSGLTSNIALISNPTGASFSWIIGTITGSVTGGIAGSGNTIAQTLTGTGTIQYIVTPTSGSCVGNPTTITVTVSPIPTLTTATTANVCSGNNANISLTSSPSGATFAWTLGAITGSVSGASNGSGSTISQVLTGNGTVDYLVTPTLGSCVGSTSTITVTVSPTPTVTTSTTSSICSGDVTSISLTSNPSGATFNWTIGAITGVVSGATSGSGNSIAQTLTGNGTVAYQVTPTIGSCAGTTTNIIVTVNPSPVLTTSTSQTACSGNVTNIALTSNPLGAIFTWTIGTITGTASGAIAGSGSTIAQTLNGVGTIEYIVTPTIGTCVGIPTIITVSVSNSSTVTTPNTAIVCSGNTSNIALTSSPSGASFSWVIGTVTGSASGASSGSGSVIAQTLTGSGTIQYIVTPSFGSCTGTPLTITVTVSPLPNMTVATTGSLCSGATTNIPLSSSPSGSTFAWTIGTITGIVTGGSAGGGNNISQTLTGNGTVEYIVTPTRNGCAGNSRTITITVLPTPAVTTSSTFSICSGNSTNIPLTSNPVGATFAWTIGTITGTASGAIAGSGTNINQVLTGTGSIAYLVTPTLGTCVGTTTTITVNVSGPPVLSSSTTNTICSGGTTSINLTSVPSGASFNWTTGLITGTVSGFSSGSGTAINQTLNGLGTVDYLVTPSFGSCVGSTSTITVTVTNPPVLTSPTTYSICEGNTTAISLTSNPTGASFSWTVGVVTGTASGAANGTGSSINQTLTGSGTVEYLVTPSITGCSGAATSIIVTVNPGPTVSTASSTNICSGSQTNLLLVSNPIGASFTYTTSLSGGTVTGFSNGSGSPIQQTLTGNGTVDYLVTPTLAGCIGTPSTISVNVNDGVIASTSSSTNICSGGQTNLVLTSTPAGATYSYTTSSTGTVAGFSNGIGSPIQQTLVGNGTVTYLVTPSLGACLGTPLSITVTVDPPSTVSTVSPTSICTGAQTNLVLTSSPVGATFNYTTSSTGTVSGFSDGSGSPIQQTLTGTGTVTYAVTPSFGGCLGTTSNIVVNVNPPPDASFIVPPACVNTNTSIQYFGSAPPSATYNWNFGGATVVPPGTGIGPHSVSWSTPGNKTVTLQVTENGCTSSLNSVVVAVNSAPDVTISGDTTLCQGGSPILYFNFNGIAPYDFTYSDGSNNFPTNSATDSYADLVPTPPGLGATTYQVTSLTDASGCTGTFTGTAVVNVGNAPTASIIGDTSVCTGSPAFVRIRFNGVAPFSYTYDDGSGPISASTNNNVEVINIASVAAGVTYTLSNVKDANCDAIISKSTAVMSITPGPDASFIVPPACINTNTSVQYFGSAPPSATYNWNFGGATVVPPGTGIGPHSVSWSTPGNKTVTLQVTENGCTSSLNSVVVAVNSAPDVTISGDTTLCQGGSPILYFNFNGIAPYDFTYSNGSNNFPTNSPSDSYADLVPTPPGLGTTTYQVTSLTDASGCTGTFTGTAVVNVGNAPTASIIGDTSVCTGSPAFVRIRFNGVAPFSYTYDDGSGPISASTNNNVEVINIASVAAGVTYTLSNVKDANCDAVISKSTAVMSITPGPDASFIVPPACINTNTSIQYFGSAPPSAIYNWNFGGATVVPPGTGIGPHSVSWSTPGNKTVTLQVTENGCTSSLNSVVVAVNSAPDVTISGDTTLCQGGSPVLYFNFNGIAPYDFTYSDGSNNFPTNSATDSYADLVPTSPGLGATTYQVTSLTDASGCTGTFTGAAVVNVIAAPTASITNDTTICEGADAFVRFNFSGLAPFTYTYNDGVKDSTVTTNNLVEIVNIPAVLANVTYTLVAVSDVNCDAIITSNTATINIVTKPVAAFDATNPIVACLNNDVTFTYTGAPVTSYQWGFDNPTTISDPDLTTAGPYAASWNTLGVKNIYLIVSDGSCVSDTAKLALTIQNAPTVVVTGDTTICSGNFAILKVAFTGTPIWILEWIDEQGTPKSKDFTVANDTIMVNPLSTYNYEFSQVTDAALCPNTIIPSKVNVNVEDTPTPDFSVSPPVSCGNSDVLVKYQSVIDPEMKFVWDFDGQSSLNPTGNSQEYNVQWNTSGIKNLQVTVTDTLSGCSASVGNSVTINPIVSATLSGNDTVCSGTSASKIQVDFTGVKPWIFTYNVNGSPVTDTADVTPYLIPTNPTVNSTYSLVSVIDSNNCSGNVSGTSDVIVKLLPDATIRKSEVICLGDTVGLQALLKVGTPSWTLVYSDSSSLGINIDTLNSNSIVDSIFVSPTVYTAYKVISVTDASGCTALLNDEQPPTVSVDSLPIASFVVSPSAICLDQDVTITFTGDVLFSPSYSWHFDNNTLPLDSTLVGPHIAQYNTTGNKTIRLILKDNATGCLSDTAFGNVLIQGAPTAVISGDTTICSGTQAFIKVVSTGTAPFTVNFNDESGPSQVTLSNLTDYISVSPTSQFIYALDSIKDNLGCINSNIPGSVQVDVNPSPLAVIAVTQDAICIGDTIIAQFKEDLTNIKLGWDFSGGDSIRNSVDIYDVSWTTSGLKPITVIATNTINGCSGSATKLVEVYPNPVATITGNDTVCNGVNASNIIINFTSGTKPWIFSYDDGSIKQDTAYSSPYVFNVSPSDTTVYSLISVSDSNSCTNIATGTATLVVRPTPEFEFSQSQSICLGDQAPLVGNLKIGIPNWSLIYQDSSSNGIVQDTVLFTKNIDTFFVSPIVTTKYKVVRGFDASGCDAIYDDEQSSPIIIVSPKPSTTFNITPGKCLADTIIATYTGTSPSANFTWDFGGGSSAKPINDVGPHSLLYPNSGLKKVKLTVEENGCSVTDSAVTNINPSPTATLINNGLSTVCAGDNVVLDLTFTAGVPPFKYTYKEGNTTKTDSTVNSVANIASNPIDTIVFRLLTIQDATCSNISNDSVVVNVKPLPTISFTGLASNYCSSQGEITFSSNRLDTFRIAPATVGFTNLVGLGQGKFNPTAAGIGLYTISQTHIGANGCTNTRNQDVLVDTPPTSADFDFEPLYCAGVDTVLFPSTNFGVFTIVPATGLAFNDSTGSIFPIQSTLGTYTITNTVDGGACASVSASDIVVIYPQAGLPIITNLADTLSCSQDSSVITYKLTPVTGNTYEWNVFGGTIKGDSILDSVIVKWNKLSFQKSISVVASNKFCFDTSSFAVYVDTIVIDVRYVTDSIGNDNVIQLNWLAASSVNPNDSVFIYRRTNLPDLGPWETIAKVPMSVSFVNYIDTTNTLLTGLISYEYRVGAINACGDTLFSAAHRTIVTKVTGNEDKGQVYLDYNSYQPWTPKEYQIWRQLDNETEFTLYQTVYNLDSVLTFNNATDDGFNQCYRVLAIRDILTNVRTDSSWSNIACVNFKNKVKIYNTFTPNSNDVNSTFYVDNIALYPDNEVYIFNRWGARVYYRRAYNNDWDGGGLPSGTYFYVVRVEGDEYKGYVFIAR